MSTASRVRRTWVTALILLSFSPLGGTANAQSPSPVTQRVVILGDSLTEGYGVSKEEAFPAELEKMLHEKGHPGISVINAGIGGSTSASGPSRLKWHLRSPIRILVVALGANDGLRGIKLEETKKNLLQIVRLAREKKVPVILAGMELPPNYGQEYRQGFRKLYQDIARSEKLPLIPFLLEGVGGEPELNQEDGIHPNEKGHERIARNVLPHVLKAL